MVLNEFNSFFPPYSEKLWLANPSFSVKVSNSIARWNKRTDCYSKSLCNWKAIRTPRASNKLGKQHIVTQLASHIFSVFFRCKSQVRNPLTWYEPTDDSLNKSKAQLAEKPTEVPLDETCIKNVIRNSCRLRKTPVTSSNDFLWWIWITQTLITQWHFCIWLIIP